MRCVEPAYTLLADQERIPESRLNKIYFRMHAAGRTKLTRPGRYDELDRLIVNEVERRFPPGRSIRVHDVAASSAITSVELFQRLAKSRSVTMKASDFYDAILCVRTLGVDFVFDVVGEPLQVAIGKIGINDASRTGAIHFRTDLAFRSPSLGRR